MKERKWPKVSIVMATLNAERVLEDCLISIASQNYPKDKIEIILGDGGSTDATKEIAKKYNALIVHNPLKTAESGKMTALRRSTGEYIALIDSDNILPSSDWLQRMIKPLLHHTEAVGSEPIEYSWRKQDGFITRYCALLGMNDPLVHFLGNYDRTNLLSGTWTEVRRSEVQHDGYLLVHFNSFPLPTIGANGTVLRASFLKSYTKGNYLFDIDILSSYLHNEGSVAFIKVNIGIIHTFCESSIEKFAKKQRRRVYDFLFHSSNNNRDFWVDSGTDTRLKLGLLKFILYTISLFPLIYQSIKGYIKKPDVAWFFHPLACWITLWEYGLGVVIGLVSKKELDRTNYRQ